MFFIFSYLPLPSVILHLFFSTPFLPFYFSIYCYFFSFPSLPPFPLPCFIFHSPTLLFSSPPLPPLYLILSLPDLLYLSSCFFPFSPLLSFITSTLRFFLPLLFLLSCLSPHLLYLSSSPVPACSSALRTGETSGYE